MSDDQKPPDELREKRRERMHPLQVFLGDMRLDLQRDIEKQKAYVKRARLRSAIAAGVLSCGLSALHHSFGVGVVISILIPLVSVMFAGKLFDP